MSLLNELLLRVKQKQEEINEIKVEIDEAQKGVALLEEKKKAKNAERNDIVAEIAKTPISMQDLIDKWDKEFRSTKGNENATMVDTKIKITNNNRYRIDGLPFELKLMKGWNNSFCDWAKDDEEAEEERKRHFYDKIDSVRIVVEISYRNNGIWFTGVNKNFVVDFNNISDTLLNGQSLYDVTTCKTSFSKGLFSYVNPKGPKPSLNVDFEFDTGADLVLKVPVWLASESLSIYEEKAKETID